MSAEPTPDRNRLAVPITAAAVVAVVFIGFLITRGGDDKSSAPTPSKSTAAAAKTPTAKLTGSGDAPPAIAVKAATVARSATGFGLAADLPTIDIKQFDTVTIVLGQDDGDKLWRLTTVRDSRGAFITPEFYRVQDGPDEQLACGGAALRIKSTRLSITIPLECLDDPDKPLRARLELTDRDGGKEQTSTSKPLALG